MMKVGITSLLPRPSCRKLAPFRAHPNNGTVPAGAAKHGAQRWAVPSANAYIGIVSKVGGTGTVAGQPVSSS
jgi:hypothetical protein